MAVNLGTLYVTLEARTQALLRGQAEVQRSADRMERDLNRVRNSARLLTGALAGIVTVRTATTIFRQADAYNVLQQRLQTATAATGDYSRVQAELMTQAQSTGTALDATVALFQRVALGAREMNATTDQVLQFTKTVQQLGVISGASPENLKAGIIQLSQAMTSGVVRAEEMNSILENIPEVAQAIARSMGTTAGELRKLVVDGKVLSSDVFQAILSQSEQVNEQFAQLAPTLGRSLQSLKTEFGRIMSEALGGSSGAMDSAIQAIQALNNNLESIIKTATVAGGALASVYAAKGLGAVVNAATAAVAAQVKQAQATVAAQQAAVAATEADLKAANTKAALTAARLRDAKAAAEAGFAETDASRRMAASIARDIQKRQSTLAKTQAQVAARQATFEAAEADVYAATQAATQGYGSMKKVEAATRARERALASLNVALARQRVQETAVALAEAKAAAVSAASTANRRIAMERLAAARTEHAAATAEATLAEQAHATALRESTIAANAASLAARGLKGALALVGGPAGLAFLAAEGLLLYAMHAKTASDAQKNLTGNVREFLDQLERSRKTMSQTIEEQISNVATDYVKAKTSLAIHEEQLAAQRASGISTANQATAMLIAKIEEERIKVKELGSLWDRLKEELRLALDQEQKLSAAMADEAPVKTLEKKRDAIAEAFAAQEMSNKALEHQLAGTERLIPLMELEARLKADDITLSKTQREEYQAMVDAGLSLKDAIEQQAEAERKAEEQRRKALDSYTQHVAEILREKEAVRDYVAQQELQIQVLNLELAGREQEAEALRIEAGLRGLATGEMEKERAQIEANIQTIDALNAKMTEKQRLQQVANEVLEQQMTSEERLQAKLEDLRKAQELDLLTKDQVEEATARLIEENSKLTGAYQELADGIAGAFSGTFEGLILGTENVADAFKKLGVEIEKVILRALVLKPLEKALSGAIGGAFGGISGGGGAPVDAIIDSGQIYYSGLARGGIVSSPTMVSPSQYAGESGPEAVLPLSRNSRGELGVSAGGIGGEQGTPVIIQIIDQRQNGGQVERREGRGPNGERQIQLYIRDEVRRQMDQGGFDGTLRRNYGVARTGSGR